MRYTVVFARIRVVADFEAIGHRVRSSVCVRSPTIAV